ncbi:MAG TPA: helix-turn-helix transcriptional regulator [Cytophagaceae bacterium]|nr:helix-turn-helix transcriptional regulator [Cytophagaceae bacterium]
MSFPLFSLKRNYYSLLKSTKRSRYGYFCDMAVFIGKLIKEVTERRGMSKSELGRRLNMSPTNVHKIFKRESIDTALLQNISQVLEYDFFSPYSSGKNYEVITDNPPIAADQENEYKKELDLCKEKNAMLEKINSLLEEKMLRRDR